MRGMMVSDARKQEAHEKIMQNKIKLSGAQVTQIAYEVRHSYTRDSEGQGSVGAELRAMERLVSRIQEIVGLVPAIQTKQED